MGFTSGFLSGIVTFQNPLGSLMWAQVGPNHKPQTSSGFRNTWSTTVITSFLNSEITPKQTRSSSICKFLQSIFASWTKPSSTFSTNNAVWARNVSSLHAMQVPFDMILVRKSSSSRFIQETNLFGSFSGFENERKAKEKNTNQTSTKPCRWTPIAAQTRCFCRSSNLLNKRLTKQWGECWRCGTDQVIDHVFTHDAYPVGTRF